MSDSLETKAAGPENGNPENPRGGTGFAGWSKCKTTVLVCVVIAAMAAAMWGLGVIDLGADKVSAGQTSITALEKDSAGISTGTSFMLTCQNAVTKNAVIKYLKITPAFAYDLEKQDGGRKYRIIPRKKLNANKVYCLSFDPSGQGREDMSWAFQTRGAFRVMSTMPQDQANGVPVNSGIEFTMSHDTFNIDTAWDYFSISPRVKGRFEKHKKTLVFVPEELKPGTVYKIDLKKGFPMANGKEGLAETCRLQFETAAPSTADAHAFDFTVDGTSTEFSTKQAPFFTVYYSAEQPPQAHVDLYRYSGQADYRAVLARRDKIPVWCAYAWSLYREDVKGLARITSFDSPFSDVDEYNHYISFPEPLKPGYYIAEIKAGDDTEQVIFQVTDLAVYLTQNEGSTLLWVNDISTGKPAPEATVLIEGRNLTLHGSASGVVLAEQDLTAAKRDYALVTSSGKEVLVPMDNGWCGYSKNPIMPEKYWKYLYLDRSLYQPGDTVNIWGVLTPRVKGSPEPEEVTLQLWGEAGNYSGLEEEAAPIAVQKVAVKNHWYTGHIKLPRLKPGYYSVSVMYGTAQMSSCGFSVETYKKPAFKLSVDSDKKALFVGQKINFKAQASFFEGTPVPGLSLNYNDGRPGTVKTDQRGEALIPFTARTWDGIDPTYNYQYLNVSTTLPEVGEINSSQPLVVFKSQVYIKGEVKEKNNKYDLKARLRTVDLSRVDSDGNAFDDNFLKDPVPGALIKGELFKDVWTRVKTGQRYNYITKETEELYNYQHSTRRVNSFVMTTDKNGVGTYSGSLEPRTTYFVDLSAVDKRGRLFKTRVYINHFEDSRYGFDYYRIQDQQPNKKYVPGDKVTLLMLKNEQELVPGGTSVLFLSGHSRIEDARVEKAARATFTFSDRDIPNLNVKGIYFDGGTYQESDTFVVAFDGQSRALNVTVTPDQKVYRPGAKVKLKVRVTDKNGNPIKGARVNLNMVDEALYSMADQWVDLIRDLYQDYYFLNLMSWKSHNHPYPGGAEYGGEGGSERRVFSDTVLFTTVDTGADGQAEVEFKLPDNLTSWRVTYHAITDDLYAGSGTALIPVRLPFFVEMSMNDSYTVGDTPVVILRGYGAKLEDGQPVSFKMQLTDPQGHKQTFKADGTAFMPLDWNLPQLKEGSYSLTVWGSSGAYRDAITKPITVVSSVMERTQTTSYLLKDGLKVPGSTEEPTTLIFSDYDKSQALSGLYQLCWQGGCRVEQRLAERQAVKLLHKHFPEEAKYFPEITDSLAEYQQTDGGISILPYAASDPDLTALVALCVPEEFDWRAFKGYFRSILDSSEEIDKSPAILGLATLHEPVLLTVQNRLEEPDLAPAVKINLALALVEIGDGAEAKKIYNELLKKYGQDLGTTMRINIGRRQDDILEATTRMALLSARLDSPEKGKLFQYLLENPGHEIVNSLEISQILKYNLQYMDPASVSFTYQLQGKAITKKLDKDQSYMLTVPANDLKNLKFSNIKGRVGLLAQYTVPYADVDEESEDRLAIKREYMVNQHATTSLKRSDLVQVVIHYAVGNRAPGGQYEVVDVLPAGLSFVNRPYNYENQAVTLDRDRFYPVEVKGRKISYLVDKGRGKITYYARVITPGTFTAEAPLLGHITSNQTYTRGTPAAVTIR